MYHLLLVKENGVWCVAFGDYSKACVKDERDAERDSGIKAKDLKIVACRDSQVAIDSLVRSLNEVEGVA